MTCLKQQVGDAGSALKLAVSRGKGRPRRHEAPKFPLESVQRRVRVSGGCWLETGPEPEH